MRLCRAFTLIELLVSLAITSALLVAIAAAFHAASGAVEINDSYFRCTQTARVVLGLITTEVRRADAVEIGAGGDSIRIIRPADQLAANEIYRQFCYEPAARRITLQIAYAGKTSSPVYELATDISACDFGPAEMGLDAKGEAITLRVPLRITCSSGKSSATLTGAAAPRRAQAF